MNDRECGQQKFYCATDTPFSIDRSSSDDISQTVTASLAHSYSVSGDTNSRDVRLVYVNYFEMFCAAW